MPTPARRAISALHIELPPSANASRAVATGWHLVSEAHRDLRRKRVPAGLREAFHEVRDALNDRLDSEPALGFNVDGEVLTRFLYDGLSRANPTKRTTYNSWRGNPMLFALIENEFKATIAGWGSSPVT